MIRDMKFRELTEHLIKIALEDAFPSREELTSEQKFHIEWKVRTVILEMLAMKSTQEMKDY